MSANDPKTFEPRTPIDIIARVTHEALASYCAAAGLVSDPAVQGSNWAQLPEWMRKVLCDATLQIAQNPKMTGKEIHDIWLKDRIKAGWCWAEKLSDEDRTHPFMMPYEKLPLAQRVKDDLMIALVRSML